MTGPSPLTRFYTSLRQCTTDDAEVCAQVYPSSIKDSNELVQCARDAGWNYEFFIDFPHLPSPARKIFLTLAARHQRESPSADEGRQCTSRQSHAISKNDREQSVLRAAQQLENIMEAKELPVAREQAHKNRAPADPSPSLKNDSEKELKPGCPGYPNGRRVTFCPLSQRIPAPCLLQYWACNALHSSHSARLFSVVRSQIFHSKRACALFRTGIRIARILKSTLKSKSGEAGELCAGFRRKIPMVVASSLAELRAKYVVFQFCLVNCVISGVMALKCGGTLGRSQPMLVVRHILES